ncbi:MAG: hypothetical protein Q7R58_01740 [bacterium]|nr:hypothetical protein [bacterium]
MNSRILPALALMLAVGIFFVYVKPTWSGPLKETKEAIANIEKALIAADEYKKRQNELASARNAIDPENLDRLSVFLPDSVDNVGLILDINALAARSGLALADIDVVMNDKNVTSGAPASGAPQAARGNPVGSVNLSLSAVGTYSALQAFLTGIEKSARLLDVQDITVKGSDTGVYNYQMAIRLYWLR